MKTCTGCGVSQPLDNYYPVPESAGYRDNRMAQCKACQATRSSREFQRRYGTPDGRARRLVSGARKRAADKGLPCDVSVGRVLTALKRGLCEVTGLPFDFSSRAFAPSLDRRDNSRGYTNDNTQVVVWIYNSAKGVTNHGDVLKLAEALCGHA